MPCANGSPSREQVLAVFDPDASIARYEQLLVSPEPGPPRPDEPGPQLVPSDRAVVDRLIVNESDMAYQSRCEHAFENYDLAHTVFDIVNTLEGYLQRDLEERD